ncbi:RYamide neuropeptides-like isoform X1 [Amphibalanus amphitrite]|uniref:RYamide neuropeptides-like isoform X1 n=1 Tax=Amphibalanus amphitrite TaxID=1232801 RepID=UPI001C915B56|nr:RYamide neuropeptides-like isoform X1 [Amphibalanus amphitrite]
MAGGMSAGSLCGRDVGWRTALAVLLLLVLLLVGPSAAYPSRYSSSQRAQLDAAKRANSRGAIRVQPKADRFYLGPRFGKRSEVPADYGEVAESGPVDLTEAELTDTDQFNFRCSLVEADRVYRCRLGLESPRLPAE